MHNDRDLLRQYLEGRDAPCPGCGFNLRGCAADRCPECGRLLSLGVSGGPSLAWSSLVGLTGAAMGTGFCLVIAAVALVQSTSEMMQRGRWPRLQIDLDREHAQVATLALVFFVLTLCGWIAYARRGRWGFIGWPAATITLGGLAALIGIMAVIQ